MTVKSTLATVLQQENLNFLLTNRIPRRLLTRFVGWLSRIEQPLVRDLSIVVSDVLPAEIIRGTIQAAAEAKPAPLVATTFFDRYTGAGVAPGTVSVSVRLTFQAPDRTLTDAEVQESFEAILAALVGGHGAVQR